jgi:bifunctional enzyme CysN/CysC
MDQPRLERLENEAIRLVREAAAGGQRPALAAATGARGAVLDHLVRKAFRPAAPPLLLAAEPADGAAAQAGAGIEPLAAWSVLDVWRYLEREKIAPPEEPPPGLSARLRGPLAEPIAVLIAGDAPAAQAALAQQLGALMGEEAVTPRLVPGGLDGLRALVAEAPASDAVVVVTPAEQDLAAEVRRQIVALASLRAQRVVLAVCGAGGAPPDGAAVGRIEARARELAQTLALELAGVIPVGATESLRDRLRAAHPASAAPGPLRLPVQWATDGPGWRGAAGTVVAGRLRRGEMVRIQPSGRTARVAQIVSPAGEVDEAPAGCAVALALEGGAVPLRGDLIVTADDPAEIADQFEATLIWLGSAPLLRGRGYLLRAGPRTVSASVAPLKYRLNVETLDRTAAPTLTGGDIGVGNLQLDQPIAFDPYAVNRQTGGFTLVDRLSGETVGAGMLRFALRRAQNVHWQAVDVNKVARASIKRQRACVLWYTGLSGAGKSTIANLVDKKLHSLARHTYLLDGDNVRHGLNKDLGFTDADRVENIRRVAEVARLMVDAGLIVGTAFISPFRAERLMARSLLGEGEFIEVFVDTPLTVAEGRDPKGLYKKARRGDLKNFTGIDSPYERPESPEITIDTTRQSPEQAADAIIAYLDARGLLDPEPV